MTSARETNAVVPPPTTRDEILMHGINELSMLATGLHSDPCYGPLRDIKDYAQRVHRAAERSWPAVKRRHR